MDENPYKSPEPEIITDSKIQRWLSWFVGQIQSLLLTLGCLSLILIAIASIAIGVSSLFSK